MMNINDLIIKTILDNPFYASVASSMPRKETKQIPTFGVTLEALPTLLYNKDFLESLSMKVAQGVMIHELLHVIFLHCVRVGSRRKDVFNIAADIVCNQKIDHDMLPKDAVFLDKINKAYNMKMVRGEAVEYYYDELMKNNEFLKNIKSKGQWIVIGGSDGEPEDGKDDKNIVGRIPEMSEMKEEDKEIIENTVKEIIDAAREAGSVPENIQSEINMLFEPPQIRWQHMLKNYLTGRGRIQYRKTHLRESRRFPDVMGRRKQVGIRALIGVDTSGSVSDSEFKSFMNELRGIQRLTGANIYIVQCDSDANKPIPLNRFIRKPFREGYGGTDFRPVFDVADKEQFPVVIYFTDGYGPAPEKVHQNVLWILTDGGQKPADYGDAVYLKS